MKVYTITMEAQPVTLAATLIQINAASNRMLVLLYAEVTQEVSETSEQLAVQILKVTTAGTGTAATPRPVEENQGAAGFTATTDHTVEGTASTVLRRTGGNILNGWIYQPVPESRLWVPVSGRLAIRLPTAPGASLTMSAYAEVGEVG